MSIHNPSISKRTSHDRIFKIIMQPISSDGAEIGVRFFLFRAKKDFKEEGVRPVGGALARLTFWTDRTAHRNVATLEFLLPDRRNGEWLAHYQSEANRLVPADLYDIDLPAVHDLMQRIGRREYLEPPPVPARIIVRRLAL